MSIRNYYIFVALITVTGLIVRIWGLAGLPPTADGVQAVSSAWEYMESGNFGSIMWQHPKLRNILIYMSVKMLGGNAWGLNFWSLAFGVLAVPLIAAVTYRLTGTFSAALIAALFLAVDPIHIDFSRQAIQETYIPFFSLLGIYGVLRYSDSAKNSFLVAAGAAFGCGLAAKWHVLFPLAAAMVYLIILNRMNRGRLLPDVLLITVSLTLIPAAVYLLTYLPWILHGGNSLEDLVDVHRLMAAENLVHAGFNPYLMENDSWAYLWFIKPVAFADFMMQGSSPVVLLAISNPFVWLATLPALVLVIRDAWCTRDNRLFFMVALFCCSYLPLVMLRRPIWVNSALAVAPLAFILTARAAVKITERLRRGKVYLTIYIAAVVLCTVPLYLLAIGRGYHNPLLHPVVELYRPANERERMPLP